MVTTPVPLREERRALITPFARRLATPFVAVALAIVLALALVVHDTSSPLAVDTAVLDWLTAHVGPALSSGLLALTEPVLDVAVAATVVVGAALRRRWDVVALTAIGPWLAVLLSSIVLKPIIDRYYVPAARRPHDMVSPGLAFPSGHETALTGVVTLLLILVLRSALRSRTKAAWATLAAVWLVLGALGLVRNHYHYLTDTIAGVCVGAAVVLLVAMAIDAVVVRVARTARLS